MVAAMASSSALVFSEPFSLPAIRLIVSSISVPPRSLAPPCSTAFVPASASFTHDVWTLVSARAAAARAPACPARFFVLTQSVAV
jgi:hypothetical protein